MAVTGVTGTVGRGLVPLLESDPRIRKVIGLSRRPWDPRAERLRKVEHRQVDVRDLPSLRVALEGVDAVVHLAFALYGFRQDPKTLAQVNVNGSRNVLIAAAAGGARRFIYTSSAAVYGFGAERPSRVDEDAPIDRGQRHFYAHHKAEVEQSLLGELAGLPKVQWTFFRPCAIVGPHAFGAADHLLPRPIRRAALSALAVTGAAGLTPPVPGPPVPLQFVHESDVGQAIHRALSVNGKRSIYNLGGSGMVAPAEIPRLVGLRTLPLPATLTRRAFNAGARLPYLPPGIGWTQLLTHPLELDTTRARQELGWRPVFSSREAVASTRRALGL